MAQPLILAQFNGSLAYEDGGAGGTAVGTGAVRFRDGAQVGVQAAFVEEGTTNLVPNPYAVTGLSGWLVGGGVGAGNTLTRDTGVVPPDLPPTLASVRNENVSAGINVTDFADNLYNGAGHPTGDYTVSAWVYHEEASARTFDISFNMLTDGFASRLNPSASLSVPPSTWTFLEASGELVDSDATRIYGGCRMLGSTAGEICWTAAPQIEPLDHASTLCPERDDSDALLTGYAQIGGAHASASTRTAAEIAIPCDAPAAVSLRYSEDGDTWTTAHLTSLPATLGTYGSIDHDGSDLVITSSRALWIGPVWAFAAPLTGTEIGILDTTPSWWWDLLDPWLPETTAGSGGGITVWWELWRATIDNQQVEDVSDYFVGGSVSLNHDRAIRAEASFTLRDVSVVNPYTDYLAVFLNQEFDDGRPSRRDQLGLYSIRVPPGTRTVQRAEGTYPGQDLTSVLARHAFLDAYNIASSTNYVTAVTTIMGLAGITRFVIPPTTEVTANAVSFPVGTTYLDACNSLLEGIGYYNLSMTPDGKLHSGPSGDVRQVEPFLVATDDDLMSAVVTQPTDTTVANVVIVIQDNPIAEPLEAIAINDAADSPTSTVNLGVLARTETRSNLVDQEAVDALAARLLSEGRSWYQVARFTLLPNPDVLMPHQTIDLDLTGRLAIFNGRWWVRTATVGFTAETAGPVLEINRVTDTITGALI